MTGLYHTLQSFMLAKRTSPFPTSFNMLIVVLMALFSTTVLADNTLIKDNLENQTSVKNINTDNNPLKNQRIISLAPHIIEILFSLGAGENVVATTEHSDFPEAANQVPRIGNYARLKIEKILAYEPDLVIAWRLRNPLDDLARLKKLGVRIVYSDPKNLEDVADEIRLLGNLTGTSKRAEILANQYLVALKNLRLTFANKSPITVFYELWSNPLTTVSNNAWPQQHLNVCGAINPFVEGISDYPQIGLEQVVMAKPQLIIQPMSKGEPNPNAVNWLQWNEIPASIHKQLIQPNSDKLHRMTPRLLEELEKLCISIDHSRQYYGELNKQK